MKKLTKVLVFLYVWLTVGFCTGTLVLLGPVAWLTSFSRERGWLQGIEDLLIRAAIICYVVLSGLISYWLNQRIFASPRHTFKVAIPAATTVLALIAVWLWMNPELMIAPEGLGGSEARFVFGPYPNSQILQELKDAEFTGVISLLHPAVVPFEPELLAREQALVEEAGIDFIHVPMLPWISQNERSLQTIRKLARQEKGRYYVHCYLGKDRVNLVRRLVEQLGVSTDSTLAAAPRTIDTEQRFERGPIHKLEDDVYLVPYPTNEEFATFALSGRFKQVISLMDPANPEDAPWVEREREHLTRYRLPFELCPISVNPYDPEAALKAAARSRKLPRPQLIHSFLSEFAKAPSAQAFAQAFLTSKPPLPPALFDTPLNDGMPEVIAPNIAVGPRPRSPEFAAYLYAKGVRHVIYLGPGDSSTAGTDREAAGKAGLGWSNLRSRDPVLFERVQEGGPWYLYGPELDQMKEALSARVGPALP